MKIIIYSLMIVFISACASSGSKKNYNSKDSISAEIEKEIMTFKNTHEALYLDLRSRPATSNWSSSEQEVLLQIENGLRDLSDRIGFQSMKFDSVINQANVDLKEGNREQKVAAEEKIAEMSSQFLKELKKANLKLLEYNQDLKYTQQILNGSAKIVGSEVDFSNLDFEKNRSDLNLKSRQISLTLNQLLKFMNTCDELQVEIQGHTSNEEDNKDFLSLSRAQNLKKYLMAKGVKPKKILSVKGLASKDPLITEPIVGSKEEAELNPIELMRLKKINRRVDFKVLTACEAKNLTF